MRLPLAPLTLLALLAVAPVGARAAEDPVFGFVPPGGRSLFAGLREAGADPGLLSGLLAQARDAEGWIDWFAAEGAALPGLSALDDWDRRTLAAWLANVAPVPGAAAGGPLPDPLPRDGRDLVMRYCQSCHIITVVVTQEKTREAWLGTLGNPSHVEVPIDAAERSEMADWLVLNGGIPIEQVPPELRAGGASY